METWFMEFEGNYTYEFTGLRSAVIAISNSRDDFISAVRIR